MTAKNLPGVYPAKRKDHTVYYRSSVTFHNKHISLGSYTTEQAAHKAYKEALSILGSKEITIEQYSSTCILPFEKRVSLINFRDNGLYISNPIYIRPKMFYYYLSPNEIMKFDVDDLFYYSSHKIMKRGNHLFVADYGIQVNIASRYNIKQYAVEGRDYRFKNGDPLDFRYSNIEILNSYHGVRQYKKDGRLFYRAVIHVNGNHIIGTYSSEVEAAIAYNKAVDLLKKNGIKKNYAINFIDSITSAEYAQIYNQLKISPRFLSRFSVT